MTFQEIIMKAMEPTKMDPIPRANRFGIKLSVFVHDEVPNDLLVRKEKALDFWNEIEGFFLSNESAGRTIYDCRQTDWEIPSVRTKNADGISIGSYIMHAVGDRIVDKNYDVWVVYGFKTSDGRLDIYFNVK